MERMTQKQWKRADVMERLVAGKVTTKEAAQALGLTPRQVRRVRRTFEKRGRAGLVHGNASGTPWNRVPDALRAKVVKLSRKTYVGFNDQHFTEKLAEHEDIELARQTVRRILREAGVHAARTRRPSKHRKRRERMPQAGLMVLWDGSPHAWLEERGPMLCLMGAIDDATGELLPGAHFVAHECSASYLRVLRDICRERGVPLSIYMDRHSALKRTDDNWTVEEQLRGVQDPTQVGRALAELEIEAIYALSPQAKGRVERLWGTLQDRLVSELRLAKARTIEEANAVLARYTLDHNRRFANAAANAQPAWRRVPRGLDLDRVCAFRYAVTVGNDNTARVGGCVIDIPPGPASRGYAHARVDVRQILDGRWRVYFQDGLIAERAASALDEVRARRQRKRSAVDRAFRKAFTRIAASLP
jgi:transposase